MKAIITVVGKDQKGIVAGVATKVAELGLNIDDISQTVLDEYFTMMAVVSSDEKKNKTISFVRREQLVSLYKYLSDNHIVWGRIQFAPSVENDASIVCNVTKTFYQQELKWRVLLQPTVQSSLVVKVLCRRLRLPVLIGLLL